jgi:hypothetical protein
MILRLIILALGAFMFVSGAVIEQKNKDKWVSTLDYVAVGLLLVGACSFLASAYSLLIEFVK